VHIDNTNAHTTPREMKISQHHVTLVASKHTKHTKYTHTHAHDDCHGTFDQLTELTGDALKCKCDCKLNCSGSRHTSQSRANKIRLNPYVIDYCCVDRNDEYFWLYILIN